VLKVPSAIIASEANYLINTSHPDFEQVKLLGTEDFVFDPRIKQDML
jgi:RES domain-containing protein